MHACMHVCVEYEQIVVLFLFFFTQGQSLLVGCDGQVSKLVFSKRPRRRTSIYFLNSNSPGMQ